MPTGPNYYTQINNLPVIDVRSKGAKGDGVADDTAAIQAALDAASVVGTITTPATVFLPRGKYKVTTALKFKHDGIIFQGESMMGFGTVNGVASILVAGATHDATPVIQITPSDRTSGAGAYRGTALCNLSIDVSGSSAFVTAGLPPPVISIKGMSNCPETRDLWIYGSSGTSLFVGPDTVGGIISENLRFVNCYCAGGFDASGNPSGQMPKAPGIVIAGSDNVQILGGYVNFFYPSIPPTPTNSLADVPGIQIIPAALVGGFGGVNIINNGCTIDGTAIANYIVSIRLSSLNFSGQWYGPQFVRIKRVLVENFSKFVQINQEQTGINYGFWRSQGLEISECAVGGTYVVFGTGGLVVQASNLLGGHICIPRMYVTGGLTLDANCTGVRYEINADATGGFFSAADAGTNYGTYTKYNLVGGLVTGQTRLMGGTDPAAANSGSVAPANLPLQCYGTTVQLWSGQRVPTTSTSDPGTFGELCMGIQGGIWYLYLCVQTGSAGGAVWLRSAFSIF